MTLADFSFAVNPVRQRICLNLAGPGTQTHCSPEFFYPAQLAQLVDHPMGRSRIELAGVCVFQSANVACEFDTGGLHPQADTEVRHLILAGISNGFEHAFDAALAKPARNQNAVIIAKLLPTSIL